MGKESKGFKMNTFKAVYHPSDEMARRSLLLAFEKKERYFHLLNLFFVLNARSNDRLAISSEG